MKVSAQFIDSCPDFNSNLVSDFLYNTIKVDGK